MTDPGSSVRPGGGGAAAPSGEDRRSALVVGGGAFGLSAALALQTRDHDVTVLDAGPVPHPDASSTDVSKIVRMDYGRDRFYPVMAEEALATWRAWNAMRGRPLFHETGFLLLSERPFEPGGFEHESREALGGLGYEVETLDGAEIAARFPAWPAASWAEGYFNPTAGWAESGEAVAWLRTRAEAAGAVVREAAPVEALDRRGGRVRGVRLEGGERLAADVYVVAAGAWTPGLLPELADVMRPVGQPVFHLHPEDPRPFDPSRFVPWAGDIARSGWYGFPALPDGHVKVANHSDGLPVDPRHRDAEGVPAAFDEALRDFLRSRLPELADAPVVRRRLCLYCDTFDGDFWIDRHPDDPALVVAAGGSGHGFKFAPLVGDIVVDVLEGRENPWAERFRWRAPGPERREHARATGDPFDAR